MKSSLKEIFNNFMLKISKKSSNKNHHSIRFRTRGRAGRRYADKTAQSNDRPSYRANRAIGVSRKKSMTGDRVFGSVRQVFDRAVEKVRLFKATHSINYKRATVATVIVLACIMTPIIAAVATNTGKVVSEESRQIAAVETTTATVSQDSKQDDAEKSPSEPVQSKAPKASAEPSVSAEKTSEGDVIQQQLDAKESESAKTSESPKESSKPANTESTEPKKSAATTEDKKEETKKTEDVQLKPGVTSPKVKKLQSRLMELDYMEEDEPTEYYGYITEYAVQLFQRKHDLEIDGIAGESTTKLLYAEDAKHYTVSLGITGTDVQELQKQLQELGYLKSGATGYFGTDTEQAVKDFQKRNGLTVDGNVGANTREVLYSDDVKEAAKDTSNNDNSDTKKDTKRDTKKDTSDKKDEKSTTKIPDDKSVKSLIAMAKSLIGKPYVRGGKGPNSFDCSGFVYYCLNKIGYNIHYMTSGGWAGCSLPKVTSISDLKAGDIVCFRGHVGIFIGGGRMIDASSSQGRVRISSTLTSSSYWRNYFICGRRVL